MLHALSNNTHLEQLDLRQNNTYALSFSKLLSNIIKQRICMQQKNILHVHGIALNITLNEMRLFKRTRIHRTMQISKNDIIEIWTQDCIARKSAFMLLTCPRLYHGPFSHLCIDTLRIILSFNIMYAWDQTCHTLYSSSHLMWWCAYCKYFFVSYSNKLRVEPHYLFQQQALCLYSVKFVTP